MRNIPLGHDGPIGDPAGGVRPFGRIYQDPVSAIMAGSNIIGGIMSSDAQADAANTAAGAQRETSAAGIAEQRRQFDAVRQLLAPYATAGAGAVGAQGNLIGLNGQPAQQQAIDAIRSGPQFQSMLQQGENSILQNASATGGLRGGNTQAALAQFSPQLLSQLINQQFSQLGGLSSLGQNAAAGTGNAGMQTGTNITNLLGQQGAATAGAALAGGRATAQGINAVTSGIGQFAGLGGFGGTPTVAPGYSLQEAPFVGANRIGML